MNFQQQQEQPLSVTLGLVLTHPDAVVERTVVVAYLVHEDLQRFQVIFQLQGEEKKERKKENKGKKGKKNKITN